jgi:hypothetical protein
MYAQAASVVLAVPSGGPPRLLPEFGQMSEFAATPPATPADEESPHFADGARIFPAEPSMQQHASQAVGTQERIGIATCDDHRHGTHLVFMHTEPALGVLSDAQDIQNTSKHSIDHARWLVRNTYFCIQY